MESQEAAKNVAEIAAVEGVDCIQMGPLDLRSDMGLLRMPNDERPTEMLRYDPSNISSSVSLPSSELHMWLSWHRLLLKIRQIFRITSLNDYKDLFDKDCLSTRGCEGNETLCHLSRNAERVLKGTQVFLGGFATSSDSPSRLLELGYHMVSGATDVVLFRDAVLSDIRKARGDNWLICHGGIPHDVQITASEGCWSSHTWNWIGLCACLLTFVWNKSCPLSTEVMWLLISKPIQVVWKKFWQWSVTTWH